MSRKRSNFVEAAKSYTGTKFIHQGRTPHVGLDCAGVVICAAQEAGYDVDAPSVYRRIPRPATLIAALERFCDPADNNGEPGLIHLLKGHNTTNVCHLAVRLDETTVLEARPGGSVGANPYIHELVMSTWTLKEADDGLC